MGGLVQNPELVRHLRMEMRPRRMAITAGVVALLCILAYLGFTSDRGYPGSGHSPENLRGLYTTYIVVQSILLLLWCLSACSQAIAGERNQKTYDFLRTTRLTSGELLSGLLPGVPVMAYFAFACSLPFSIAAGLGAGFPAFAIFATYAMLVLLAVVISLAGLTISMMTEKPKAGELLVLVFFLIWPWIGLSFAMGRGSPLPGLSSIAIIPGVAQLYGPEYASRDFPSHVPFFAFEVPTLFVSVVIYASLGAWMALALVRNLKKELDEIRLLSHWQSIGFVAYLNVLILAMLDLRGAAAGSATSLEHAASEFSTGYLFFNWLVLYAIGVTLLTPAEQLKTWWRRPASGLERYWSEDGPPWLWMIACAVVVLVLFTGEVVGAGSSVPLAKWNLGQFAGRLAVVLIYAIRDVLFLQSCLLTRMKSPVTKGIMFLFLYYLTVSVVISVIFAASNKNAMEPAFALLTPAGALMGESFMTTAIGAALQVVLSIALLVSIEHKIPSGPQTAKA